MKVNFKKIINLVAVLIISISLSQCQKDDDVVNSETKNISLAKEWFIKYESTNSNYELFKNLNYDWTGVEVKKNTKDGTELIIVPVVEVKKDENETWEQRLYIYKLNKNTYKALLYEFYPQNGLSIDSNIFSGYISVWDLKSGFVRSAKLVDDKIVENGVVVILSNDKLNIENATARLPQESNFDGDTSERVGDRLRPVVVQNNYVDAMYYISRRGEDITGGGTYEDYSFVHSGGGASGGSTNTMVIPPSCESFNFISKSGSLWQEALVKNIKFKIVMVTYNNLEITQIINYSQPISFGVPTNLKIGNTNINSGVAANLSAKALKQSMDDVINRFGSSKEVPEITIKLFFEERLKYNFPLYLPGGRVQFNSTSIITSTEYKTGTFTSGNCN